MRQFPLCDMKTGTYARVVHLNTKGHLRRRFMDIGLVEGTPVGCIRKSPFGDPKAYLVRGAVFAIRKEDASEVFVEECR